MQSNSQPNQICFTSVQKFAFTLGGLISNFISMCARSMVSSNKPLFFLLFAIFENFCYLVFLSCDKAVRSKRFRHAFTIFVCYFTLKDKYISSEPRSRAAQERGELCAEASLCMSPFFTMSSSSKRSFSLPFTFQIHLPASKISGKVVYTERGLCTIRA